jgi:hypothetical protein
MIRKFLLLSLLGIIALSARSQIVTGTILSDTGNLTVVKVWGNHYERGFAYGYLCADNIKEVYTKYYRKNFGEYLPLAHKIIAEGSLFRIDSVYFTEAKGIIAGMDSAGIVVDSMDAVDLIAANCLLDLLNFLNIQSGLGCSSLMSWGKATEGTILNGHPIITRNLDWSNDRVLVNNQIMLIHLPAEKQEQSWIMIGFAGQMSALSGINRHMAVFQHVMTDVSGTPSAAYKYEPVWFSLRKALERDDYNKDGHYDVKDLTDVLAENKKGYADSYIICGLAGGTRAAARVAVVAELTPIPPYITLRNSHFPDSIPGDNLYAANNEIKRIHSRNYCDRYYAVVEGLSQGLGVSPLRSWMIMTHNSVNNIPESNLQVIQYAPEDDLLKVSVATAGKAAYMNQPLVFSVSGLMSHPASVKAEPAVINPDLWPQTLTEEISISIPQKKPGDISVILRDITGSIIETKQAGSHSNGQVLTSFSLKGLRQGVYIIQVISPEGNASTKFMIHS